MFIIYLCVSFNFYFVFFQNNSSMGHYKDFHGEVSTKCWPLISSLTVYLILVMVLVRNFWGQRLYYYPIWKSLQQSIIIIMSSTLMSICFVQNFYLVFLTFFQNDSSMGHYKDFHGEVSTKCCPQKYSTYILE